jgi:hypothetical protein
MGPTFHGSGFSARLSHIEAGGPLVRVRRHAAEEEVNRSLMEHSLGLVRVTRVAMLALRAALVELLREKVAWAARVRTK